MKEMRRKREISKKLRPIIFWVRSSLANSFNLILSSFSALKLGAALLALVTVFLLFELLLFAMATKINDVD